VRSLSLPGGLSGNTQQQLRWILSALRAIEQASYDSDLTTIFQNYSVTGAFTATRSLDATTPTLANVVAVLATIIQDCQKGGANRTT
jgi:hypothetical protein